MKSCYSWKLVLTYIFKTDLRNPLCTSYLVIKLFGRNFMWKSLLVAILVHVQVIELFGYLASTASISTLQLMAFLPYLVHQHTLFTFAAEIGRLKTALVASEHQLHLTRHDIRETV